MKSNLPTLLGQQDFMSSNLDMVKSAKLEPLTNEQIEYDRKYASISMRKITEYNVGNNIQIKSDARIGAIIRIRLPANFTVIDTFKLT